MALKLEHYEEDGPSFQACVFLRSPEGEMLCSDTSCSNCTKQEKSINKQKEKLDVQQPQSLKNIAPLSKSEEGTFGCYSAKAKSYLQSLRIAFLH